MNAQDKLFAENWIEQARRNFNPEYGRPWTGVRRNLLDLTRGDMPILALRFAFDWARSPEGMDVWNLRDDFMIGPVEYVR